MQWKLYVNQLCRELKKYYIWNEIVILHTFSVAAYLVQGLSKLIPGIIGYMECDTLGGMLAHCREHTTAHSHIVYIVSQDSMMECARSIVIYLYTYLCKWQRVISSYIICNIRDTSLLNIHAFGFWAKISVKMANVWTPIVLCLRCNYM